METIIIKALSDRNYDDQYWVLMEMETVEAAELVIGIHQDEWAVLTDSPVFALDAALHDGAEYDHIPYWETYVYRQRMDAHLRSISLKIQEVNFDG